MGFLPLFLTLFKLEGRSVLLLFLQVAPFTPQPSFFCSGHFPNVYLSPPLLFATFIIGDALVSL